MLRARLAHWSVVVGLGLATGCTSSWSPHSLFSRLPGNHEAPCADGACCSGDLSVGPEGPILGETGPLVAPPPGINGGIPAPVPPGTVPPLTAPPGGRLVPQPQPQPQQATPMPYSPSGQ
jgi:hypothetical protein